MSVYFIRADALGLVKIGFAVDPWKRFYQIQTASPCAVVMEAFEDGGMARERQLHALFAEDRERGEWFRRSPELVAHIATLPAAIHPRSVRPQGPTAVAAAAGISVSYASQIMSGSRLPSFDAAIKIYRATGRRFGKLVRATDSDIDVLEKFERARQAA